MRSTATKLTIFTIFTIIVTMWLASTIGKLSFFRDDYQVDAVFTDATGILNGDPVKIAGVPVGKVTGFEVDKGTAIVTMKIDGDVEIPDNSTFSINFLNLLGQRVINVAPAAEPSDTDLADGDQVGEEQTEPALDLSVVFNNLRPLIQSTNPEDINTVAHAVLDIFKGREGDLAGILDNLGNLADTLAGHDQRLARLIGDFDQLTGVLNRNSASLRGGLRNFTDFMEALADMTPKIESVIDQLNNASTKFGGVIERNRANLDADLADLKTLLDIVNSELGPLDKIAKNLKEVLLATARSQSYGHWWNLYVVNLCPEIGAFAGQVPTDAGCTK
ncbi:MAG TPA: MlaD family protein [Actinomycetota bacterium]|nr:MlaD family protein [Actinomycetota bacterium]